MKLLAKTLFGLEDVLAQELAHLGALNIQKQNRAVAFTGDISLMYKANLYLRTALRILNPIHHFNAKNEQSLYKGIQQVDWRKYMKVKQTLAVNCAVHSPYFKHSHYVELKTKDAIVDQFRNRLGKRPSVDLKNAHIRINIHIYQDQCTVSLDSSGNSLHKRAYRLEKNPAPLNEVLAAGMILLSGWKADRNFVDPMCGSGTLPIEAAMMAYKVPPGMYRDFSFMNWPKFDNVLWKKIHQEAQDKIEPYFGSKIIGADLSGISINIAKENLRRSKLVRGVKLQNQHIEDFTPPKEPGTVIINPPYGERMQPKDIEGLYKSIGDQLKKKFEGYDAWILSSNKGALKRIGLRASKKLDLYNGSLACKYYHYEMYRGKKPH